MAPNRIRYFKLQLLNSKSDNSYSNTYDSQLLLKTEIIIVRGIFGIKHLLDEKQIYPNRSR